MDASIKAGDYWVGVGASGAPDGIRQTSGAAKLSSYQRIRFIIF